MAPQAADLLETDMKNQIIKSFVTQFNSIEQNMGKMSYIEDGFTHPNSGFSGISGEIKLFYTHVKLEESPTLGGDFFLQFFMLDEIEGAQSGWAGPDDDALQWRQSFILFGDRNGDALVYDSANQKSPVYGSIQKRSFLIADSFLCFLEALLAGVEVEERDFKGDTRDDDMNFKPAFLARVEERVSCVGGGINAKNFIKFFFG